MNKHEAASFFLQGMEKDLMDMLGNKNAIVGITEVENPKIAWLMGKNGAKFTLEVFVKEED